MTEPKTEHETTEDTHEHRHGHCGPWGGSGRHNKMWMFGPMMAAKMASKYGRRGGRYSRAQQWMYDNPTDEQIVEFLEEYQRDLEQQVEDVRTRIEDLKSRNQDS